MIFDVYSCVLLDQVSLLGNESQLIFVKQLAAQYLSEKRSALELAVSMSETSNEIDSNAESVVPSAYVGQFARLLELGDNVNMLA